MAPMPRGRRRAKSSAYSGNRFSDSGGPPLAAINALEKPDQGRTAEMLERKLRRDQKIRPPSPREMAIKQALEVERCRIARDLHDHAEQWIIGIIFRLSLIEQSERGHELQTDLDQVRRYLDELDRGLRRISRGLRDPVRHEFSLQHVLAQMASRWTTEMGIPTNVDLDPTVFPDADGAITEAAAKITQALLNNVAKHAGATATVNIRLSVEPDSVVLSVQDDGPGFRAEALVDGPRCRLRLGMTSVRERLAEVGGRLTVKSARGEGTTVTAVIPVAPHIFAADGIQRQ